MHNHGKIWTAQHKADLIRMIRKHNSLAHIMTFLGRSEEGIRSQLVEVLGSDLPFNFDVSNLNALFAFVQRQNPGYTARVTDLNPTLTDDSEFYIILHTRAANPRFTKAEAEKEAAKVVKNNPGQTVVMLKAVSLFQMGTVEKTVNKGKRACRKKS